MNIGDSSVEIQFPLHGSIRAGRNSAITTGSGRLPRVSQVMALAIQFQDMIQRGEVRDYADLARLGCLTRERMSQIMELVWLAPDIQQEILEFAANGSRFPINEVAARRIAASLAWSDQRRAWSTLTSSEPAIW